MAYYYIEEEAWKCPKHPSKNKRRTGVCSICLRDRLSKLCPNCANVRPSCTCTNVRSCSDCTNVRPCSNCSAAASTTSPSSTSGKIDGGAETALCRSKSIGIPFLKSRNTNCAAAASATSSSSSGKIHGGGEMAFCRSKSVGISFLKSRNTNSGDRKSAKTCSSGKIDGETGFFRSKSVGIRFLKGRIVNSSDRRNLPESEKSTKTTSFWWIFKSRKRGKDNYKYCNDTRIKELSMMRSRSVNVEAMTSLSGGNDVSYSPEKLKGWYLISPMKVFRQSKAPKLVNLK